MFFSSNTASAHKQPLLQQQQQQQQQHTSPVKKTASSKLRNLLFHSTSEPEDHDDSNSTSSSSYSSSSEPTPTTKMAVATSAQRPTVEVIGPSSLPSKAASNPRDNFQRANSHPIRLDASAALSASRSFDPSMSRTAALDGNSSPQKKNQSLSQPQSQTVLQPPSLRSTVFGSCSHVLSTAISVLFQTIKTHHEVMDMLSATAMMALPPSDAAAASSTVRKAKLLYISLLEKAQKERGEWQGFSTDDTKKDSSSSEDQPEAVCRRPESARDLLTMSLADSSKEETFAVLHELLELSFRNLRVAVACPAVYSKHKNDLMNESLECPVSLQALLSVSRFLSELSRDEKSCLLCLLNLWYAICVVDPDRQDLKLIVEERHTLILSEASEMEFMQQASRKTGRHDPTAVHLLVVMTQYRDMLFSELEFYTIRQDMQIEPSLPVLSDGNNTQQSHHQGESRQLDHERHHGYDTEIPLVVPAMMDGDTHQLQPAVETRVSTPSAMPPHMFQSSGTQTQPLETDSTSGYGARVTVSHLALPVSVPPSSTKKAGIHHGELAMEPMDVTNTQQTGGSNATAQACDSSAKDQPSESDTASVTDSAIDMRQRSTGMATVKQIRSPQPPNAGSVTSPRKRRALVLQQQHHHQRGNAHVVIHHRQAASVTTPVGTTNAATNSTEIQRLQAQQQRQHERDLLIAYVSVSVAVATVCTLASVVVFALRKQTN